MSKSRLSGKTTFAVLLIVLTAALCPPAAAQESSYHLSNGMEVVLKENHSSPMIASIIFVKSGSKYESRYENGITHFLEHLLFNGTVNMTREGLDASVRDLGGYLNAFTRPEMTAYLVLVPRQYIDYGLTVQADMLFNSIIPEEELAKERKVVIEEINRDSDAPGAAAEAFFTEKAYDGTSYDRPVLGYKGFIENIPREALIDYWKRYYQPGNMTALIIGDFDSEQMRQSMANIFGGIGEQTIVTQQENYETSQLDRAARYDTVANVTSTYIDFSFPAPRHTEEGYLAMDLLSQYLSMDEVSPLMAALKGGAEPLATEASVSLVTYDEFSRLQVSVITDNPAKADTIVNTILGQMKGIGSHVADRESLEGIKTTVKCEAIYNSEKLHYLGFIIAPMMMTVGWDFIQSYPDELAKVNWADCQKIAKTLDGSAYIATVVKPMTDSTATPYRPHELSADEVIAHFDTATFPAYDLEKAYPLTYPVTDSVVFELVDKAQYHREVLDNGLTVIVKTNPDTRVFAFNVIGKNRSADEPEGKTGITDFVNRCIEKGTLTRDASELSRDLAKIGANVTLYDNPWIPYDDRYTTHQYSFMKFETIDEFAQKGFNLFAEMLLLPAFDPLEVESVRRSMMGVLGRQGGSTSNVARDAFYATLFEGKAYAKPIMGTPMTLGTITAEDLRAHHAGFYNPSNIVLSIASNKPADEIMPWVRQRFGNLATPLYESKEAERPEPLFEPKLSHTDLDKEQISMYMGNALPGADNPDAAAIAVASAILSDRLALNLREKQGLAYSVGAGATFDRNFGWFYSSIGTSAENYQKALDGITLEIDKLKLDGPSQAEVGKAKNQLWGRLMSTKLSSINQAFYLGVDEYLGRPLAHDSEFLKQLSDVDIESIRRVAAQHFRTDAYVLATAGKKP